MRRWDLVLVAALVCVVAGVTAFDWRVGLLAIGGALAGVWWLLAPVDGKES